MPLMSHGHARELWRTCQRVTSYDNQARANLWMLCVTAYLDLGLSFQGFEFHIRLSILPASWGSSWVPCLCLQTERAVLLRARTWLSSAGNTESSARVQLSLVWLSLFPACATSAHNLILADGSAVWPAVILNRQPWHSHNLGSTLTMRFVDWHLLI